MNIIQAPLSCFSKKTTPKAEKPVPHFKFYTDPLLPLKDTSEVAKIDTHKEALEAFSHPQQILPLKTQVEEGRTTTLNKNLLAKTFVKTDQSVKISDLKQDFIITPSSIVKKKLACGVESIQIKYNKKLKKLPKCMVFKAKEVLIGDMHGNTLRLIYDLICAGAISFTSKKAWSELRSIFCTYKKLSDKNYLNFTENIEENIQVLKDAPNIILIGDLLAERVSNDILTLKLLHILASKGLNYKINLSNHDFYFICFYLLSYTDFIFEHKVFFSSAIYFAKFCKINKAKQSVRKEKLKLDLLFKCYLDHLQLFDYKPNLKLFTCHATVTLKLLRKLFLRLYIFDLYINELDNQKTKDIDLKILEKIFEKEKETHEIMSKITILTKKDNIADFLRHGSEIFHKIKDNIELFKLFIMSEDVMKFCNNREIKNTRTPFPGVKILIQGHDSSGYFCIGDKKPYYVPQYGGYVRYSLDNYVCKRNLRETSYLGKNLYSYLIALNS